MEIRRGLMDGSEGLYREAFWFRRDIEDLLDHVHDSEAREYLDMLPIENQLDQRLDILLQELRDEELTRVVRSVATGL